MKKTHEKSSIYAVTGTDSVKNIKKTVLQMEATGHTSEILLAIFTLTNCGTLQELEYHAGYYAGTADQAAAVGEITREQRGQILRVLHYISAGERERLENE